MSVYTQIISSTPKVEVLQQFFVKQHHILFTYTSLILCLSSEFKSHIGTGNLVFLYPNPSFLPLNPVLPLAPWPGQVFLHISIKI